MERDRGPHHHQAGGGARLVFELAAWSDRGVKVYLDGIEQLSGSSVDTTTRLVTFGTPPALGVKVTADFDFDVPVRFDTDHMAVIIESYGLHSWQQIPIVQIRG
jgi:uncharacterized protein (TIGR02217 family)